MLLRVSRHRCSTHITCYVQPPCRTQAAKAALLCCCAAAVHHNASPSISSWPSIDMESTFTLLDEGLGGAKPQLVAGPTDWYTWPAMWRNRVGCLTACMIGHVSAWQQAGTTGMGQLSCALCCRLIPGKLSCSLPRLSGERGCLNGLVRGATSDVLGDANDLQPIMQGVSSGMRSSGVWQKGAHVAQTLTSTARRWIVPLCPMHV